MRRVAFAGAALEWRKELTGEDIGEAWTGVPPLLRRMGMDNLHALIIICIDVCMCVCVCMYVCMYVWIDVWIDQ